MSAILTALMWASSREYPAQVEPTPSPPTPTTNPVRPIVEDTDTKPTVIPPGGKCDACEVCLQSDPKYSAFPGRVRISACQLCGNKRCPHATDHRLSCTRSNDVGQWGSSYGDRVGVIPFKMTAPLPVIGQWCLVSGVRLKSVSQKRAESNETRSPVLARVIGTETRGAYFSIWTREEISRIESCYDFGNVKLLQLPPEAK